MKKVIYVLMAVSLIIFSLSTFATDLEDFKKEQVQLQERLIQGQQTMQNIQVRLIELNALIRYIEEKEAEKAEIE